MKNIRKALTFRASSIGDCLMGKYLLENIHAAYPEARCGIVVANRGTMIRDLFRAYPWLEVIEASRRDLRSLFSLGNHFLGSDIVVTQYSLKSSGRFSPWSKLAARILAKRGGLIGFTDAAKWNELLYDSLVSVRSDMAVVEHDRAALRAAGIPLLLPFPTMQYEVEDSTPLVTFNLEAGKFIVVHLFAGNTSRGLSPDKKVEMLVALHQKLPGTHLVISGGASDREEAFRVSAGIPATIVAGELTLQEMMHLIDESRGVVSLDTGVAHITAQLHKPLVVLSSCLGANWWLPEQYGPDALITVCSRKDLCVVGHIFKEYPECLAQIDCEDVAVATAAVTS